MTVTLHSLFIHSFHSSLSVRMDGPLTYALDPITFRSVGEKQLAELILSQEGQRDTSGQDGFLTRERLLQQLTRKFTSLRSLLRHSPPLAYQTQSMDLEADYPKCPRKMMREHTINNSQLSLEDPTRQNIEYRRQVATRNALLRERELESGGGRGKETQQWIEQMEQELLKLSRLTPSQRHTTSGGGLGPAAGVPPAVGIGAKGRSAPTAADASVNASTSGTVTTTTTLDVSAAEAAQAAGTSGTASTTATSSAIPRIGGAIRGSGSAASLVVQLKKTRQALTKLHQEHNIVKSILDMDANASLKNAITRMFADPKNAANISQEEHERREREFREERQRAIQFQNELLRDERESIERELAHFKA